ncbi:MAG: AAA family ATPase [Acidobacteria bacterium]|nr:AAA family ATPase [Acidobacteriota bacterium]
MPSCPTCGDDVADGARFCASCGHELTNRVDERRVVTVLFGDLVGFTAMSEHEDPERIKRVIDDVFAVLADDITSFGGNVDKVVGDGIVALFGATIAHEDDAERAVRAALRMQRSVADFAERESVPLEMRIGVNTGEVLVGSISADGDWTAMGDVVNTASRLQSMADPGSVVVGEVTHEATHRAVFYQAIGDVELRGRDDSVRAWIARTVLGLPGQRRGREARPIVGREGEISLLCNAIDSAFVRRRSFTMIVAGESGIGRSRLVDEVVAYATEEHSAALLEAPCVPYGEADRWFPVAELVRYAIGIRLGDPPAAARAAVSDGLSVAFGTDTDDAVVRRATTGLMHLLGYETPLAGIEPERAAIEAARAFRTSLQARLNR